MQRVVGTARQLGIDRDQVLYRRHLGRENDAVLRRLEKLKAWRKSIGMEMQVESDIILPKPYLGLLSENPPKTLDELRDLMKDTPSRVDRFGAEILMVLGVKLAN